MRYHSRNYFRIRCTAKCFVVVLLTILIFGSFPLRAQHVAAEAGTATAYQASAGKVNSLVHTRLNVRFDFALSHLHGQEWITLRPHFYPTDSLMLDAKGMDIKSISLVRSGRNIPLRFTYDSLNLAIKLDRVYRNTETYVVYIEYTAQPSRLKVGNDSRGLYFINPTGENRNKPTQVWTQGEPENSSAWFPTIDKPNQKTTQEISITVPSKYTTLSNGRLAGKKVNKDGTRTDTWKMELPHAPYLFMMAVGDFAVHKDSWRGKEVSYYTEPKFAPYAKAVFGHTPEAIEFFSKTLGVDYPWYKYSQVVVHDFVSGAMENTTASVFGEDILNHSRGLTHQPNRTGVVHELFHQWFGNYTTMESWSNLALNESFADFGEIMWLEYKFGKDVADEHVYRGIEGYLKNPELRTKNLVRFNYRDKSEVFDGVTYQKGGRILNMLRAFLGREAFYKGLNLYLKANAFGNAEAHHLRLALEEASGKDLTWFFNQWFFGAGHPELKITYNWNETAKTQALYLQQTQHGPAFVLPLAVDLYIGGIKQRKIVWMRNKMDTFRFQLDSKPHLVNVDAEKTLIARKTDSKTLQEYAYQYAHAPLYLDRYEAIEAALAMQSDENSRKILLAALKDPYTGLQIKAITGLDLLNSDVRSSALPLLLSLAKKDVSSAVRAEAILALGTLKSTAHLSVCKEALNDQSDGVKGAGLKAIALSSPVIALALAKKHDKAAKGNFKEAVHFVYVTCGNNEQWPLVYTLYGFPDSPGNFPLDLMAAFIARVQSPEYARQGINAIKSLYFVHNRRHMAPVIIEKLEEIKAKRKEMNDPASAEAAQSAILAIKNNRQ